MPSEALGSLRGSGRGTTTVELTLELAVVVVAWLVSLFIAIFAVPRLVAPKAREAWTTWLMSPASEPYMDKVADRVIAKLPKFPDTEAVSESVMKAMEPRLSGLEERIASVGDVTIDPSGLVQHVRDVVVPEVRQEIDKLRSWWEGKRGVLVKGMKDLGEGVTEIVGEDALAEVVGSEGVTQMMRWEHRLTEIGIDEEWKKGHKAAAVGLDIVRDMFAGDARGTLTRRGGSGFSPGRRRRK